MPLTAPRSVVAGADDGAGRCRLCDRDQHRFGLAGVLPPMGSAVPLRRDVSNLVHDWLGATARVLDNGARDHMDHCRPLIVAVPRDDAARFDVELAQPELPAYRDLLFSKGCAHFVDDPLRGRRARLLTIPVGYPLSAGHSPAAAAVAATAIAPASRELQPAHGEFVGEGDSDLQSDAGNSLTRRSRRAGDETFCLIRLSGARRWRFLRRRQGVRPCGRGGDALPCPEHHFREPAHQ